ncbi:MAG TPA: chromate transporter [Anaeromyxobacteraceae bacterium]|nr:chromate transporter [Anaeromyxobacteraceae bacterium]
MDASPEPQKSPRLSQVQILALFLRAGLAFGGGLGILAVLEEELVRRRRLVSHEEFLTDYALGRIVPSGTMTALAVAFGYRLGGPLGTVTALVGLVLPAFTCAVGLTIAYGAVSRARLLDWMPVTLLPAALAFIVAAALRMSREVTRRPGLPLALAVAAFAAAFAARVNPALVLLAGGAAGVLLLRRDDGEDRP